MSSKYSTGMKESFKSEEESHLYSLLSRARDRSKKKKLKFDLDEWWLANKMNKGVCEVTGLPFSLERDKYNKRRFAPSIDKIDPDKGYTQDNCQLVCWMYNQMKFIWSHEDLIFFCRAVLIAEAVRKNAL